MHFSRTAKIAAFLHEYDYVQEFSECVDRMYMEMERAGLPLPEYLDVSFILNTTIRNGLGATSGTRGAASGVSNLNFAVQMELPDHELSYGATLMPHHPTFSAGKRTKISRSEQISL